MASTFLMLRDWIGMLWILISGAWILINMATWLFPSLEARADIAYRTISLSLSPALRSGNLVFAVRHVRDGKDEVADHGRLLNEDIPFKAIDKTGKIEATIGYAKNLGFQYKCYLDFLPPENFDGVRKKLNEAGFENVSADEEIESRIWFTIKGKPTALTSDNFINNFAYP